YPRCLLAAQGRAPPRHRDPGRGIARSCTTCKIHREQRRGSAPQRRSQPATTVPDGRCATRPLTWGSRDGEPFSANMLRLTSQGWVFVVEGSARPTLSCLI